MRRTVWVIGALAAFILTGQPGLASKVQPETANIDAVVRHNTNSINRSSNEWEIHGALILPQAPAKSNIDLSVFLPIIVAIVGIGGAWFTAVLAERRKARIEYVNEQLKCLYGPLFSLSQASDAAWEGFRRRYKPGGAFFDSKNPPTNDQLKAWVSWMNVVFMPINERMVDAITHHADLIEGEGMPQSFIDLIAHVEGYRVTIENWKNRNFEQYTSILNFPPDFYSDVREIFLLLRKRQSRLMEGSLFRSWSS